MIVDAAVLGASYLPVHKMSPRHYHKGKKFLWALSALLVAETIMLGILAVIGAI
jgi:hypothetical protein